MFRDYVCVLLAGLYGRGGRIQFAKEQSRSIPLTLSNSGFGWVSASDEFMKAIEAQPIARGARAAVENRIVLILGSGPTAGPNLRHAVRPFGVRLHCAEVAGRGLVGRAIRRSGRDKERNGLPRS